MTNYKVLLNQETYTNIVFYLEKLRNGDRPGRYLQAQLKNKDINSLNVPEFIELLMRTKKPQIFAEFDVRGDGNDWNQKELAILGDISIATPVIVYDNGKHHAPQVHQFPFPATLLFTPGALLRNGYHNVPVDWKKVVSNNRINPGKYYQLYERRLLPVFIYANQIAKQKGKTAFITIPGIGCGQFAGQFRGQLGLFLKYTLITLLKTHGQKFSHIKALYYDPYRECENERLNINQIDLMVRPLTKGNENKPQLCQPKDYQEEDDNFTDCELFSVVAWDHVSWPGNDFYKGSRATDDGVKAAATNSMEVMTGIKGQYDALYYEYRPPKEYCNWKDVIVKNNISLEIKDNLMILP